MMEQARRFPQSTERHYFYSCGASFQALLQLVWEDDFYWTGRPVILEDWFKILENLLWVLAAWTVKADFWRRCENRSWREKAWFVVFGCDELQIIVCPLGPCSISVFIAECDVIGRRIWSDFRTFTAWMLELRWNGTKIYLDHIIVKIRHETIYFLGGWINFSVS